MRESFGAIHQWGAILVAGVAEERCASADGFAVPSNCERRHEGLIVVQRADGLRGRAGALGKRRGPFDVRCGKRSVVRAQCTMARAAAHFGA
jgi:hypothetical protein